MKVKLSLLFGLLPSLVHAQGLLLNDSTLRDQLNWLDQQGVIQLSTSTWPLSASAVDQVLAQAKPQTAAQRTMLARVKQQLNVTKVPLSAQAHVQSQQRLPQQFGQSDKADREIAVQGRWSGANWESQLRVNVESQPFIDSGRRANVEGSYLAARFANQWLVGGQIPVWWGPGQDSSLIRGDASRPVTGFTLQRDLQTTPDWRWLNWMGPWQYQVFAGQLQGYHAVPDAKLLGMRLTIQPWSFLELGANRVLQWGGQGRRQNLNSLWNAIKGDDNFDYANLDNSNQIAGLDIKFDLQPLIHRPIAMYGQYVGEDEAGLLPAKNMFLFGTRYASSYQQMPYQIYGEWADSRSSGSVKGVSYNHWIYTDGYYQHGYPLGAAIGGDSEMISVGGSIEIDRFNRLAGRIATAKVNESALAINQAFPQSDQLNFAELTWTLQAAPQMPLTLKGWLGNSDVHGRISGAAASVTVPLDERLGRLFR